MSIPAANDRYIALELTLDAIGAAKTYYVASPVNGTIRQIFGALDVIVDGDNVITSGISGVAITGGGFTFALSGTVAGQVKVATPTALNVVKKGDGISITTDGGGTVGQARFTILIEQE